MLKFANWRPFWENDCQKLDQTGPKSAPPRCADLWVYPWKTLFRPLGDAHWPGCTTSQLAEHGAHEHPCCSPDSQPVWKLVCCIHPSGVVLPLEVMVKAQIHYLRIRSCSSCQFPVLCVYVWGREKTACSEVLQGENGCSIKFKALWEGQNILEIPFSVPRLTVVFEVAEPLFWQWTITFSQIFHVDWSNQQMIKEGSKCFEE